MKEKSLGSTDAEALQMCEKSENPEQIMPVDHPKREVTVIGKIDLDAINQRTRPKKKSKKELEAERKLRVKTKRTKKP